MTPAAGPVDLFQRIDRTKLYPPFRDRLLEVVSHCRINRRADYWATRGFATYGEQTALWEQGRLRGGDIVTHAKGGESPHCFGLAVDFAFDTLPDVPKLQPGWQPQQYLVLGEEALRAGLAWGGTWKMRDCPHVQLAGYISKAQLGPVKAAFDEATQQKRTVEEALAAAWQVVDKLGN